MKLIFLGSGSAFTVGENNFHSNMILEDNQKKRLLIDCGSDARWSLHALGLSHRHITDVYISHLHADHAGGLEWLAFTTKFDPQQIAKPILHISEQLVTDIWEHVLRGGLQSLNEEEAELTTYFDLAPIGKSGQFQWQETRIQLVQTHHISDHDQLKPSFGVFFQADNINCFITTDTQFKPELYMPYYEKADIIFHDCEITEKPSGVHSHYSQLVTLDPAIKSKMWLYHYNPRLLPLAEADGFRGFVKRGQIFDFLDPRSLL